ALTLPGAEARSSAAFSSIVFLLETDTSTAMRSGASTSTSSMASFPSLVCRLPSPGLGRARRAVRCDLVLVPANLPIELVHQRVDRGVHVFRLSFGVQRVGATADGDRAVDDVLQFLETQYEMSRNQVVEVAFQALGFFGDVGSQCLGDFDVVSSDFDLHLRLLLAIHKSVSIQYPKGFTSCAAAPPAGAGPSRECRAARGTWPPCAAPG